MGIGHVKQHSFSFFVTPSEHRFSHGGVLRQKRAGRGQRPLSGKETLHVVFKVDKLKLKHKSLRHPENFKRVHRVLEQYSRKFFVKIEQASVQNDHIHLLLRTKRRSNFHNFFRVTAGQIAQRFKEESLLNTKVTDTPKPSKTSDKTKAREALTTSPKRNKGESLVTDTPGQGTRLWKYRPFSRVVRGYKAYKIVRNYIQLNEQEAKGKIKYQRQRLKGLSSGEWAILWS